MKYQFIQDHRHEHRVTVLCKALGIKRSSYYDWRSRPESRRAQADRSLLQQIRIIHTTSRGNYGAVKTWHALQSADMPCGLNRVVRLRRIEGIEAKRMRRLRAAQGARNNEPAAPNLLNREFQVAQPDRVWVGDITFIATRKGILFLAVVIDLYSRQVVGWSMSDKQNRYLVRDALLMAITARRPRPGLIHHTDHEINRVRLD